MRDVTVLETLWRCLNLTLASAGFILLVSDIIRRKRLHLRQRFYQEAVLLMILSLGWASADALLHPPRDWNVVRSVVVTVALTYFLLSVVRVRRFNRRVESEELAGHVR